MSAPQLQIPEDFIIENVELSADRFDQSADLTNVLVEFNIFESIDTMFLTGSLVFVDDSGLLSALDLSGTERISATFSLPSADSFKITKTFIVTGATHQVRTNDSSTIVNLQLIEEIGFLSQVKKFSKSYRGTTEEILSKICKDQLGIDLIISGQVPVEEPFKVVVPFLSVEQALKWVLNKASTVNGSPYFLFTTFLINGDNLVLTDLDTILKSQSLNPERPFIYSTAFVNNNFNSVAEKGRMIQSVKFNYQGDTLNFAKRGYFGSDYSITSLDKNLTNTFHHNISDVYRKFNVEDVVNATQEKAIIDDKIKLNDVFLNDYNSRNFHQVTFSTFEGINNYYEEQGFSVTKNRLTSKALLNLLNKESMEINMPGIFYLTDKIVGPGSNITILILSSKTNKDKSDLIEDKSLSGTYMIHSKRHLFSKKDLKPSHLVSVKLCRISKGL